MEDQPPKVTYLPGVGQAADGRVAETKHDSKERVEIFLLLEAVSTRPSGFQEIEPRRENYRRVWEEGWRTETAGGPRSKEGTRKGRVRG